MDRRTGARERGETLRRELQGFLWLASFWGILTNVFAGVLALGFQDAVQDFATRQPRAFWISCVAGFLFLLYLAAVFLHRGLAATLREKVRSHVVLPLIVHSNRVETGRIPEYAPSLDLQARFAKHPEPEDLAKSFQDAATVARGNPFRGVLHEQICLALIQSALESIGRTNQRLFNRTPRRTDYDRLAPENVVVRLAGLPEFRVQLPRGVSIVSRAYPYDGQYKQNHDLIIDGAFGQIRLRIWAEWGVLSENYWGRSFRFVAGLLKGRFNGHRSIDFLPSCWVLKIPFEISTEFENTLRPWHFLSETFEQECSWAGEVLEDLIADMAWEDYEKERLAE